MLASTMSNVDVVEHIKGMLPISLFSYVITAALFTVVGMQYSGNVSLEQVNLVMEALDKQFNITPLAIVPVVLVLGLLANRKPAFPVISFGALLGLVWAIAFQDMDPVKAMHSAYSPFAIVSGVDFIDNILGRGGMESMLGSVAVIIFGLGFGGLLEKVGILSVIASAFEKRINSAGSLTSHTIGTAFLANVFGSAMYVSLILTPRSWPRTTTGWDWRARTSPATPSLAAPSPAAWCPGATTASSWPGCWGGHPLDYLPYMGSASPAS